MFAFGFFDWDIKEGNLPLPETLSLLRRHDRPVYRAFLPLGQANRDITAALQTPRPDDGEKNLWLSEISVHVGPVVLSSLSANETFHAGWLSVSLSGNGYLFPWTPPDLTTRAAALPPLRQLHQLCTTTFPVPPPSTGLTARLKRRYTGLRSDRVRRRMGKLYPLAPANDPAGWLWGVAETG